MLSLDTIKEELAKRSQAEQDSVRDFLLALSYEQNEDLRTEIETKLDSRKPGAWVPIDDALDRLGFTRAELEDEA